MWFFRTSSDTAWCRCQRFRLITVLAATLLAQSAHHHAAAQPAALELRDAGAWLMPVVVSPAASAAVLGTADDLIDVLGRMTGEDPVLDTSGNGPGIHVGLYSDFPAAAAAAGFDAAAQDYVVISTAADLYILGSGWEQVEQGMWHFAETLGYRQYFPATEWEIVPSLGDTIVIDLDLRETPVIKHRKVTTYGCGEPGYARGTAEQWAKRNRTFAARTYAAGHAWQRIIRDNQALFDANPALANGNKLCVEEQQVQDITLDYMLDHIAARPHLSHDSLAISDGTTDWYTACPSGETDVYSPSDRQLRLVEHVLPGIQAVYPDVGLAVQAYGETAYPPNVPVPENTIVEVMDGYSRGLSFETVAAGYQAAGADQIALYDYLGTPIWFRDLPRQSRSSRPERLAQAIEKMLAINVANPMYHAEAAAGWGGYQGLGKWILSRLLWAPGSDLPAQIAALEQDFINNAFADVTLPMQRFFDLMRGDSTNEIPLTPDFLHQMYSALDEAWYATVDADTRARVAKLILYTRYVELYWNYDQLPAGDPGKVDALEAVLQHAFRARTSEMTSYNCMFNQGRQWGDALDELDARYGFNLNQFNQPSSWVDGPFNDDEIAALLADGLTNNPPLGFELVDYGLDLVPVGIALADPTAPRRDIVALHGPNVWYFWSDTGSIDIDVRAGIYYDVADAVITVEDADGVETDRRTVASDEAWYTLADLTTGDPGLHVLRIEDWRGGVDVEWTAGVPFSKVVSNQDPPEFKGFWRMYFYVPQGTTEFSLYSSEDNGEILYPDGSVAVAATPRRDHLTVAVPEEFQGQVWQFNGGRNGDFRLLTIPPQVARSPDELLLPRTVAIADNLTDIFPESCADIMAIAPDSPNGLYEIDPDGVAGPIAPHMVYCEMTLDDGGWTRFYAGTNGHNGMPSWVVNFELNALDCPDPETQCLRQLPANITLDAKIAVTCGSEAVKFGMNPQMLDYWQSGVQSGWEWTVDPSALTAGADVNNARRVFTGTGGNRGFIVGDPVNRAATFASASPLASFQYCNGTVDTTSAVTLMYRE